MSVPFLLIYRASLLLAPVSDPALSSSKTTPWGSNHGVGDLRSGDGRHLRLAVIGKRYISSGNWTRDFEVGIKPWCG
ncbi:unnamed protein product [Urochloa humidicola]